MDHIENEGKKGYCLLYIFLFFFLFIVMFIYIYHKNFQLTF